MVDDHDVVHWGFRLLLARQPWVERCVSAHGSRDALALARRYRPHVAVVDLFLDGESGADLCETIRRESPQTRVLLISGAGRMSQPVARAAGASGFITKDSDAGDVAAAVRAVAMGRTAFRPRCEQVLGAPANLSRREREVLALMATGATNREIAERLFLSPHTIKEQASSAYRKLSVRNRAAAVSEARKRGLID